MNLAHAGELLPFEEAVKAGCLLVAARDGEAHGFAPATPGRPWGALRALSDGRMVGVVALIFGARICIGPRSSDSWEDCWDYPDPAAALLAWDAWDPEGTPEPEGWIRHPASGRRRPEGDAAREFVQR